MAENTKPKKNIHDEAKKAMDLVQHLELDLQEIKKHLTNIQGDDPTGTPRGEISHTQPRELSHTQPG